MIKAQIEDNYKNLVTHCMRDPCLFGDYRNALDEAEPRLYEDLMDYEAVKALFQEVFILCFCMSDIYVWNVQYKTKWNEKLRIKNTYFIKDRDFLRIPWEIILLLLRWM